jgi:phage repressor protein C with HTH and peptisase S24 domain
VGTAAGERVEDMGWLQLPGLPLTHGQWVAVYADGESMQPTVQDGDLLVCRRLEDALYLRQNTVCVVCTADNAIVKRVRLKGTTLLMSSDNPSYEPYTLPGHEVTQLWEVIRRVTGHLDPLPPFSAELESRIAALEKRRK